VRTYALFERKTTLFNKRVSKKGAFGLRQSFFSSTAFRVVFSVLLFSDPHLRFPGVPKCRGKCSSFTTALAEFDNRLTAILRKPRDSLWKNAQEPTQTDVLIVKKSIWDNNRISTTEFNPSFATNSRHFSISASLTSTPQCSAPLGTAFLDCETWANRF